MSRREIKHSTLAIALSHAILADQIDYRMAQEDAAQTDGGDVNAIPADGRRYAVVEPQDPPRPAGHKPYA